VKIVRAGWTSASFLVYAGALLALVSALEWQAVIAGEHGSGAWAGWSVLFFAVAAGLAGFFRRRERPLVACLFAFVAVGLFGAMVGAFFDWWGWLSGKSGPFSGFHWGDLGLELLILLAAVAALKRFHFPLLVALVAAAAWFFVTDVLSSGGNWSAWVTLIVGFVFYFVALGLDGGESRPYGFWLHVAAGLLIGGALLYFWHTSDRQFALIIVTGLVFIGLGSMLRRSSYAVLGAVGLALATGHYTLKQTFVPDPFAQSGNPTRWAAPVGYLCLGLFLTLLGMLLFRRRGDADET
jgi:hypothetical protein